MAPQRWRVKQNLVALVSGLLFAMGLGVAGMTRPEKVVGFLDFFGKWDPSLAMVMVGAIGVNAVAWQWARRRGRPVLAPTFQLPNRTDVDRRLLGGAALFGIGWGLGGYCPGPSLVSLATGTLPVAVFVATMLAGMWIYRIVDRSAS